MGTQRYEAGVLLGAEHAVSRVLGEVRDEAEAYPRLLAAIGQSLAWDVGAVWTVSASDAAHMRCAELWHAPAPFERAARRTSLAFGEGLPGRVWATTEPAWVEDVVADQNFPRAPSAARAGLRTAFCFPLTGARAVLGAIEFLVRERREPDHELLETMASLGSRIGQSVERWRAEDRLRESDARKSAILDAALDCIVTIDAAGLVVEVNQATERTFGYTASEMIGRDLADLVVPPPLREAHRRGVARYVAIGRPTIAGHPLELPAMRADGSEFPVEIAITRPQVAGPPLFTGYLRDAAERKRHEQALRSLADEQAALRRVATTVASEAEQERVFAVVTEEVGRLLGGQTSNMVRYEPDEAAVVVGAWSTGAARSVPVGTRITLDGPTVAARILRSGRPERLDSYEGVTGSTVELLRRLGFRSAVGAPIALDARLWGAVMVSSLEDEPFPPRSEQRIADFAELVALALANAHAREELAASRARIVQAGDAERRRIERNLHDGAQQRLVSLLLTLRLCDAKLARDDPDAPELLRRAIAELSDALAELRELARGIHPAILTDRGLVPALELLAGRTSIPVAISVTGDLRLPRPVEAAAYYLVAEALTNTTKHARASAARVHVAREQGDVLIEVSDDGVGGADGGTGSGLRGLADRVEALGGRLELTSAPGAGTTLRARIPCP